MPVAEITINFTTVTAPAPTQPTQPTKPTPPTKPPEIPWWLILAGASLIVLAIVASRRR